jgi:transposase
MDTPPLLPSDIWERTPPEAQALLLHLATRVATLEATVQELREPLRQDSRTSSRPPSSDPPTRQRERRRRQPSGRRPGGQPGHRGQTRMLLPVAEVDEVIVLQPAFCVRCQQSLDGDDPQPQRHHVFEIPPIRPVVTEDQWHRLSCPGCGEATPAAWPAGVPRGMMGPRAQAVGSLCPGAYRLSKRTTQRVLDDLCGLQVSVGTISQLEAATTEAVAAPVEEARTFVQEQSSAHLDETGWREGRQRAWLWVAATTWVTVFVVRLSRGGQVARAL